MTTCVPALRQTGAGAEAAIVRAALRRRRFVRRSRLSHRARSAHPRGRKLRDHWSIFGIRKAHFCDVGLTSLLEVQGREKK